MTTPESILLLLTGMYLLKILFFSRGCRRASVTPLGSEQPFVSVILAARNEEQNIERCLKGLALLQYPVERREIILIDDQSTDRTGEIIRSWEPRIPGLRLMRTEGKVEGLHGKANAVAQAIAVSRGEIIMTTDADCRVPPTWIDQCMKYYTPEVGCVCGHTMLEYRDIMSGMQAVDWAYLLTIASAGVGWNLPLSAVGNNMSFRRAAYDEVGGYTGVGFSVTEDFVLFKAIGYRTRWKIRFPLDPLQLVWSRPCAGIREIYLQKKRWGRGGVRIHPLGYLIMSVGFFMSVAILAAPFLLTSWWVWFLALAFKWIGDAWLLRAPLSVFRQYGLYRYFIVFEIYYVLYVTLLPFIILFTGKVSWKGRRL